MAYISYMDTCMDISIIIVNWNTRDLLRNCLNSLYKTITDMVFEIVIVDNGSHDGSVAMLRKEFPDVIIVENRENRGFGAANNQALLTMKGRYALLLNTDTIVTEKAVYELFSFMEENHDAAMAGGQLLNRDGSKQNSIAHIPTLLTLLANTSLLEYVLPKRFPSKRYDHKEPIEIESSIGACMLVRKSSIDEVGIFDERYFFFFEETDWAYRMRRAGWKIYHVPSAKVYHLQGQSIGGDANSRIEFYRSRYIFFDKWKGRPYNIAVHLVIKGRLLINWLFTMIANTATLSMNRAIRHKWIVYSKLILWHMKGRP